MPTIVGGWVATKKRGRDDEIIERDRNAALERRKELRRRKSPSSQSSLGTPTKRRQRIVDSSPSWIKPPCENLRRRKHRLREPISPQRELFPKKSKLPDNEVRTVRKRKSSNRRLEFFCERCGDKIISSTGGKCSKRLVTSSVSTPQYHSRGGATRTRKRSKNLVTPDQEQTQEQTYSSSEKQPTNYCNTTTRSKRRRPGSKVLSFGDDEDDANLTSTRFSSSDFRKDCHSTATRNNRSSKSKKQKSRRLSFATKQLGLVEPDFARSARYLYETIRRANRLIKQDTNQFTENIQTNDEKGNFVADSFALTVASAKRSPSELSRKLEAKCLGGDPMSKKSKSQSEMQFKLVRNILLGDSSANMRKGSNCKLNNVLNSSERTVQFSKDGENFCTTLNGNSTSSSEVVIDVRPIRNQRRKRLLEPLEETKKESPYDEKHCSNKQPPNDVIRSSETYESQEKKLLNEQLQPFSTQQEDFDPITRYKASKHTFNSPKMIATEKNKSMNEHQTLSKRKTLLEKDANKGITSQWKMSTVNSEPAELMQKQTNGENASPSQTPSTSSSAILSLPTSFRLYSPSQASLDGSRSSSRNSQERTNSNLGKENKKRKSGDPLKDIEFWQRVVEQEERMNQKNSATHSFKHTIASLILAKNSNRDCSSRNRSNNGFLWLPSILEGGVARTGLFEE